MDILPTIYARLQAPAYQEPAKLITALEALHSCIQRSQPGVKDLVHQLAASIVELTGHPVINVQKSAIRVLCTAASRSLTRHLFEDNEQLIDNAIQFVLNGCAHMVLDHETSYDSLITLEATKKRRLKRTRSGCVRGRHVCCSVSACCSFGLLFLTQLMEESVALSSRLIAQSALLHAAVSLTRAAADDVLITVLVFLSGVCAEETVDVLIQMDAVHAVATLLVITDAIKVKEYAARLLNRFMSMRPGVCVELLEKAKIVPDIMAAVSLQSVELYLPLTYVLTLLAKHCADGKVQETILVWMPQLMALLARTDVGFNTKSQLAQLLLFVASKHTDAQEAVGAAGGIGLLAHIAVSALHDQPDSKHGVLVPFVSALLSLTYTHPANHARLVATGHYEKLAASLLHSPDVRVQSLACMLVQPGCKSGILQPLLFSEDGNSGVVVKLLQMIGSAANTVVERALNTLCYIVRFKPENARLCVGLNSVVVALKVLTDCSKSTAVSYTCAMMLLSELVRAVPATAAELITHPDVFLTLVRMAHFDNMAVRRESRSMLRMLWPAIPVETLLAKVSAAAGAAVLNALTCFASNHANCPICMEGCDDGDADGGRPVWVALPCAHVFHSECITTWLVTSAGKNNTCPLCKREVMSTLQEALHITHTL
jgi:hypothetical protein